MFYKLQARSSGHYRQSSLCVLYGREWEDCLGADNLIMEECQILKADWIKDDRLYIREMYGSGYPLPHHYQIVAI